MTDYTKFKILIIGDTGVGKTSLLTKHVDNIFREDTNTTIGVDFTAKTYTRDEKRYDLQIWDTAGQERFRTVTRSYYRDAHAAFVVFDLCNKESFDNVEYWVNNVHEEFENRGNKQKPILILIGNKSDLPCKAVSQKDINAMAQKLKICSYISTSAKTGDQIDRMFESLLELLSTNKIVKDNMDAIKLRKSSISYNSNSNGKCCS